MSNYKRDYIVDILKFILLIFVMKDESMIVNKILNIITKIKIKKENKIENILLDC